MRAWPRSAVPLWMVVAVATVVAGSVIAYGSLGATDQASVVRELPKLTYQFLLVVWLGAFLKFVLDRRAVELARRDARDEYRAELVRRTVDIADVVRRVPFLVGSQRSYPEYESQMRAVIDAYVNLRSLDAEIEHQRDTAFAGWDLIAGWFQSMEQYLETLIAEFTDAADHIAAPGARAAKKRPSDAQVWSWLSELPVLRDMLATRERAGERSETTYSRQYLEPYRDALNVMRTELVSQR
jgi:hypothetical protein